MVWDRIAAAVAGRRSWLLAAALILLGGLLMTVGGANSATNQSPTLVPAAAGSAQAAAALRQFPGGDRMAAILVIMRSDGGTLSADELAAATAARDRMQAVPAALPSPPMPAIPARDGRAAIGTVFLSADLSGFALNDAVQALRAAAADGLPPSLTLHLTGGPAFGADIANAFSGANINLLAVTALVVTLLLVATYRSPVLWLLPLTVLGFADRVAAVVGGGAADLTGLTFDGATSGITSVLVFGAGTNYALLLISRYREELRAEPDHRTALRRAVRAAGPAILASNATVVLALLTLILASIPSTRSLGVCAASGLVVAAACVLLILPPLLAVCGRRVFWPLVPRSGETPAAAAGVWHRIAAAVARRPVPVLAVAVTLLTACASGLLTVHIGLSQTEQFRVRADSVVGFDALSAHFPGGAAAPTVVIAATDRQAQVQHAITATAHVVSATTSGQAATGLSKWTVVLDAAPSSPQARATVGALRQSVESADPGALVGGPDAQALDVRNAAAHDRLVLIPAILAVILVVLYLLLRSALAPPILLAATILGALAALGLGGWAGIHIFGFPALDDGTPLFAFLFLAALGVDYTIFLVTRAREEAARHGTRDGMVRAVSATGGVITSAGIVLAAVFCVLGVLPLIVLTQLGIIVGLGILLDTFVVRTLVIPALFAIVGDRIWWPRKGAA